jgi:2-haloacid dehalogenase
MALSDVKALVFDVFGTVVDYRGTIAREGEQLNRAKGLQVDWAQFADAWRTRYRPAMDRVMQGALPWTNLDALHRLSLNELLSAFQINDRFTEEEKDRLNRVWHRLQPWPDAIAGLTHLRTRFVLATLSNGNVALLVNMAKYSALPWDCILSAELVQAYKPDPHTYQMAINLLGLRSHEVMMVAAHQEDLRAAQAQGMQAAFVPRPLEHGLHNAPDLTPDPKFEVVATDFMGLAQQLGTLGRHHTIGERW